MSDVPETKTSSFGIKYLTKSESLELLQKLSLAEQQAKMRREDAAASRKEREAKGSKPKPISETASKKIDEGLNKPKPETTRGKLTRDSKFFDDKGKEITQDQYNAIHHGGTSTVTSHVDAKTHGQTQRPKGKKFLANQPDTEKKDDKPKTNAATNYGLSNRGKPAIGSTHEWASTQTINPKGELDDVPIKIDSKYPKPPKTSELNQDKITAALSGQRGGSRRGAGRKVGSKGKTKEISEKKASLEETVFYNNLIIKGIDPITAKLKSINFFLVDKIVTQSEYLTSRPQQYRYDEAGNKFETEEHKQWKATGKYKNPHFKNIPSIEETKGQGKGAEKETDSSHAGAGFKEKLENTMNMIRNNPDLNQAEVASKMGESAQKEVETKRPDNVFSRTKLKDPNAKNVTQKKENKFDINVKVPTNASGIKDRRFHGSKGSSPTS